MTLTAAGMPLWQQGVVTGLVERNSFKLFSPEVRLKSHSQ